MPPKTEKSEKAFSITPKEYREFLGEIELVDLALVSCSADGVKDKFADQMQTDLKVKIGHFGTADNHFSFSVEYTIVAYKTSKKDYALKLAAAFLLDFASKKPLPEDFFAIYQQKNLHINSWPYFREFAQNMTQRMNLPPLTLPLFKS